MPAALPLITLLTDFGTRDSFVASMKGVILTITPSAHLVDLSHDIAPHAVTEAAYCLQSCYHTFPEGTIHVAVVDPGVGSARRPILVKTARYVFVAPDNGILTPILDRESDIDIRQLENRRYQRESPGATFHGRDIFAPAAAWLAQGEPVASFGRVVTDPVRLEWPEPMATGRTVTGQIVYVDRFGNLISNIPANMLKQAARDGMRIMVGGHNVKGMVSHYAAAPPDVPHALINSHGMLEIFLRERSASQTLHCGVGATVEVVW